MMAVRLKDEGVPEVPDAMVVEQAARAVDAAYRAARAAPRCDWALLDGRYQEFFNSLGAARMVDANPNSAADQASRVARLRIARTALAFFEGQQDGVALSPAERRALEPVHTAVLVARLSGDWDRLRQLGDVT